MSLTIRAATSADLDQISRLLCDDAETRNKANPSLWRLESDAESRIHQTIKIAIETETASFRQSWLIAELGNTIIGVTHSILLQVPPIYAGRYGPPGLIMEDCFVASNAPEETQAALLKAAEADLIDAGALILLASSITGGSWEQAYSKGEYAPLTAYFTKSGLTAAVKTSHIQSATEADVLGIVAASAVHRRILDDLNHLFWEPHEAANARFGAWMTRSLTLGDRNMFVAKGNGRVNGYAISQPATRTHFPTPHDTSGIGVIDDFYHEVTEEPEQLAQPDDEAKALFLAAEAARAARGDHSILVVCPAHWTSKIDLLEQLGYRNAITWHIKMVIHDQSKSG